MHQNGVVDSLEMTEVVYREVDEGEKEERETSSPELERDDSMVDADKEAFAYRQSSGGTLTTSKDEIGEFKEYRLIRIKHPPLSNTPPFG